MFFIFMLVVGLRDNDADFAFCAQTDAARVGEPDVVCPCRARGGHGVSVAETAARGGGNEVARRIVVGAAALRASVD